MKPENLFFIVITAKKQQVKLEVTWRVLQKEYSVVGLMFFIWHFNFVSQWNTDETKAGKDWSDSCLVDEEPWYNIDNCSADRYHADEEYKDEPDQTHTDQANANI